MNIREYEQREQSERHEMAYDDLEDPLMIKRFLQEDNIRQGRADVSLNFAERFRGYRILPGYEYGKIIIAHERYADNNDARLFHSVNIVESNDIKANPNNRIIPTFCRDDD